MQKHRRRATEPNSQTEKGKEAGRSGDERESGYDSIDPLRDVNATELSVSALIRRDGANQCNTGEEREGEKVVERGHVAAQGPRGRECGRGEWVKAEREGVLHKSKEEGE